MSGLWSVSTLLCFATNMLLGKGAQDWSHPAFKGGERCCARHQSCGKRGKEAGGEETSAEGTCPPPEDTASGFPSNPQHTKAQLLPKESLLKPLGKATFAEPNLPFSSWGAGCAAGGIAEAPSNSEPSARGETPLFPRRCGQMPALVS